MKKFIFILLSLFFVTGCYDNVELNDLALINGIGIDYKDNKFNVSYEILNNTKSTDNETKKSYTEEGEGKTISDAFINASYKTSNKAYFAHLKIILLSESIVNEHLKEITDFLIRDPEIRDEFRVIIVKDSSPIDVFKLSNDEMPVVTDYIISLFDNDKYNNEVLAINESYEKILSKILSKNYDIILNSISIDNKVIKEDNSFIFKKYKCLKELDRNDSALYNLLNKHSNKEYTKKYDDKTVTISASTIKSKIDVNNKIKIDLELEGTILENNANLDLKDTIVYSKLNEDFNKIIKDDINDFIKVLQENESDILGFQNKYYEKYRKNNDNLWITSNVEVNVNLVISKKGFIFEVDNNEE